MFSSLRKWLRRPEIHHPSQIRFLCEQDGPPERLLIDALRKEFAQTGGIERAYLVRADYGDPAVHEVLLCIKGPEDLRVVRRVGDEFARLFGAHAHLDTLFLTEAVEEEVRRVASPFFTARTERS